MTVIAFTMNVHNQWTSPLSDARLLLPASASCKDWLNNLPQPALIQTTSLQPMTQVTTTMMTFDSMDDDDDEPYNIDYQQPVDLLAIQ